jgi:hypothetical protein
VTRALLAAAAAALALCAGAAAHNLPGGTASPYTSTVGLIVPAVPGVFAAVLGQDDRLWIDDSVHRPLVVLGYEGEPYLRFDRTGVYRNANSPATYVNRVRYGAVAVPASATQDAKPRWVLVSRQEDYQWHDHRIHWMSTIPPPVVRRDPSKPHRVFRWTVPVLVDGRRHAIVGTLDYAPPAKKGGSMVAVVAAIVLTLLAIAGAFVAVRVLRRSSGDRSSA